MLRSIVASKNLRTTAAAEQKSLSRRTLTDSQTGRFFGSRFEARLVEFKKMWKPGSNKPDDSVSTPGQKLPPSNDPHVSGNNACHSHNKQATKSSSSPRKRLSGSTMNMKFMKRKKEMMQNEEQRKAATAAVVAAASNGNSSVSSSAAMSLHQQQQQEPTAMDVDHTLNTEADERFSDKDNNIHYARVSTSVDMYGMQAALIGRRSFGGFNPAIERAYSDSKASIENRASNRPKQMISDEELLERYKEIAMQRDGDGRGVGNLDSKVKKRKRQGLR